MNFRTILLSAIACLTIITCNAQQVSEKRTFRRTMAVNKNMTVELYNKYGNIQIVPWDKDSVSITAEVQAFASGSEKLTKMLDGISVSITQTSYIIRAQTDFNNSINALIETFKGITGELIPFDSNIDIDYYVSMPSSINIKIDNSYGDVILEDILGTLTLNVANGSFRADSIVKASSVDLTFCDATINSINTGNITISYSDMVVKKSENLNITSRSSKLTLEEAGKLNVNSRRDKYYCGEVRLFEGDSYFSDLYFDKILAEINLTIRYGSISSDLVWKDLSIINIGSQYSDINFTMDPELSYYIDIKQLETFVSLPEKNADLEKNVLNEEKKEYITFGTVGKAGSDAKVKIDALKGTIKIR